MSSSDKHDARAAELPDEDEHGCKFQQVEGLATVDAEEIPCEISVEDDFVIDENAEDVDEEMVEAIVAGKKKSALTRWKHWESLKCAKTCRRM